MSKNTTQEERLDYLTEKAAEIAVKTVSEWLRENLGKVERVIFNVFKDEDKAIYEKLIW